MTRFAIALAALLAVAPAAASDWPERAALGGAFGGALGALLGGHMDGRSGAIIGGALGAAAGTAIATERHRHSRSRYSHGYYVDVPRGRHWHRHEFRSRHFDGHYGRFGDHRFRHRARHRDHDLRFRFRYD